jgi:hypothetical protein
MVTLNTVIYEGNFEKFLNKDCWFFAFQSELVKNKLITVNNLTSSEAFNTKVDELRELYDFDIVYVSEKGTEAIEDFKLGIDENTFGYYYTVSYFVAINAVKTKYILNVASDCQDDIVLGDEFITASIKEIETNTSCSTTMVAWTKDNKVMSTGFIIGEYEQVELTRVLGLEGSESEHFNFTSNFSDQFFFGSIDKLKKVDYNLDESYASSYNGPHYGGYCFEKRMVAHQIYSKTYNHVYKGNQYYIHDGNY